MQFATELRAMRPFRRRTVVWRNALCLLAFACVFASTSTASAQTWRELLDTVRSSETTDRDSTPDSPYQTASERDKRLVKHHLRYLGYLTGGQSDADVEHGIAAFREALELQSVLELSIEGLLERLATASRIRETTRWAQAEAANSVEAYQAYLASHEGFTGGRTALARERIAAISEGAERERQAVEQRQQQAAAQRREVERLRKEAAAANAAAEAARLERERLELEATRAQNERERRRQERRRLAEAQQLTADPEWDYPPKCSSGYIIKRELITESRTTHPHSGRFRGGSDSECRIDVRFNGRQYALEYLHCWSDGGCLWQNTSPSTVGDSSHSMAHLRCGYGAYFGTMPGSESLYVCWFRE